MLDWANEHAALAVRGGGKRGVKEAAAAPFLLHRRGAAAFLALIPQAARLTVAVRFAKNLKGGDRAFNTVEGRKIVTMIYYDQLINRTALFLNYKNFSLTKYVTRKYSIVAKVHKIATCISTYEITVSI